MGSVVAPNLATLIGDTVGARLISHAGSLTNLAKYPASTVQILGAEKALFRALKTKGNTPKYGLIFHSSFIARAGAKNKVDAMKEAIDAVKAENSEFTEVTSKKAKKNKKRKAEAEAEAPAADEEEEKPKKKKQKVEKVPEPEPEAEDPPSEEKKKKKKKKKDKKGDE